ncbi:NAD(P)/FAD-dependent oxidoreductase [Kitasatospora sp. NPDC056181]|uniref:NAD(P)/FAD-dependent oxidoreductase n=1 Tax=Kitasatospora sp. NPDC056181 TaxID=3345737 RepID=UPI0035E0B40E
MSDRRDSADRNSRAGRSSATSTTSRAGGHGRTGGAPDGRRADGHDADGYDTDGYDVVVVGGGAAGLNAALVLARARRRVAVLDAGQPRNAPAAHLHGFLSRDGMSPAALLAVGRDELAGYGVDLLDARADHLAPVDASGVTDATGAPAPQGLGFLVHLAGGPVLRARRVIVATGLRDGLPELPGLAERWGRDVLHCPYCHGYEVADRPLGVLGTHPGSVQQALLVKQWSDDVVFFPHARPLDDGDRDRLAARGVRVAEGTVRRLVADGDRLRGVELAGGEVVPREAVFVFPQPVPRDALLSGLGCARDEQGWVVTDRTGRTGVPGVWAVGNVADPRALVVTAAGQGAAAGFAVNHHLVDEEVEQALAAAPL